MFSSTGRQQFQFGRFFYAAFEITRQLAGPRDDVSQRINAVNLQREPGLERAETTGKIGSEITGPRRSARQSPLLAAQVSGGGGESLAVQHAVAHQNEARVIRHLPPFVKVERQRIRALDSAQTGRQIGRQYSHCPEGAVHVKPHMLAVREIGQCVEVVDGPGIRASGGSDHQKRRKSGAAVRLDGLFEFGEVHPSARRGWNQTKRIAADPAKIHRARHAAL